MVDPSQWTFKLVGCSGGSEPTSPDSIPTLSPRRKRSSDTDKAPLPVRCKTSPPCVVQPAGTGAQRTGNPDCSASLAAHATFGECVKHGVACLFVETGCPVGTEPLPHDVRIAAEIRVRASPGMIADRFAPLLVAPMRVVSASLVTNLTQFPSANDQPQIGT
jgi:hypothetical protein